MKVILEKPAIAEQLKKFPSFSGTRKFITVFTTALDGILS
jgi:hypothetical protein